MGDVDAIVASVLKKLGVNRAEEPHWITRTYRASLGVVGDGYTCSFCGKHSWVKRTKCDGCNSIMKNGVKEK